jgi:hypothetical protein
MDQLEFQQWADYQSPSNWMVLLVLLDCQRQQRLTVGIFADVFDVHKGIANETTIKLMHKEIGILRRHGTDEKMCI